MVSLESSSADAQYDGTFYKVTYHPYYGSSGPTVNGACNYEDDYSAITVTYYGDVVSTEWNPQLWAGTVSNSDTTVVNWYEFKNYNITEKEGKEAYKTVFQVRKTVVFTGWALASEFDADGKPIQEVNRLPGDIIKSSELPESGGTIHLYATWGVLNDVKTALAGANFSTGNVFTNYMLISANGAAPLSSTTGVGFTLLGHDLYVNTYLYIHGRDVLQCDVIIASTVIRYKDPGASNGSSHGDDPDGSLESETDSGRENGLYANGHILVIGADVETEGSTDSNQYAVKRTYPEIYGGPVSGTVKSTKLIIHSGIYSNIVAGSLYGSVTNDTFLIVKDVTVFDSLVGGSSKGAGTIGVSTYVYATSLYMPGDYWEEKNLHGGTYTEVNGVVLDESTVLTGGSNGSDTGTSGTVIGNTNVFLSGDSEVWDVQAGGRRASAQVNGMASVSVSGKALVKHALCGSITDGVSYQVNHSPVKTVSLSVKDSATVANVFGAGYDTFYSANYASIYGSDSSIQITVGSDDTNGSPTIGFIYGGGYRGTIGVSSSVSSGNSSNMVLDPVGSITITIHKGTILNDVFAGGRGGLDKICHSDSGTDSWGDSDYDTTGYSVVYANSVRINIGQNALVKGNVYGGGESVPVITSYDGNTSVYGHNLGSSNKFVEGVGVASVVCPDIGISVSGTVLGSVYGGGKGVDVSDVDSSGRHKTAYIFAMLRDGGIVSIPWVSGSSTGTTMLAASDTFNYNSYASSSVTPLKMPRSQ